jgi:hypothetical protein
MKRALGILAGFMAAALFVGCEANLGESRGGGAPLAYAPSSDAGSASSSDALRALSAAARSGGPYAVSSDGGDPGRALFDGSRFGAGAVVPASYSIPAQSARASVRSSGLASSDGARLAARRGVVPPLPDDPALLETAARASGSSARGAGKVLLGFAADQIAQGYERVYPILSRAGWNAAPRRGAPVPMRPTRVTIHHTDGRQTMTEAETAAEVRSIQSFHMGRERGWNDIAYHFLIDGAGRVVEGRPAEVLGSHVLAANENNIGIAMMGDFEKIHPTRAQVESLTRLVSYLAVKYKQDPSAQGFVQPHQHYGNTDCPGRNMMTIFAALRRDIDGETQQILARGNAAPGSFQPVAVVDPVGA